MTAPRRILPGKSYVIERRCTERMFLLGADPTFAAIFSYCLAEAALRFGVLVHGGAVMPNHLHIVVTDVYGQLPRFAHLFFTQFAKAINAHTGHTESVFGRSRRYHCLELVSEDALAHEIAYVLANPAKAGLVDCAEHWPGFITSASDMLTRRVYTAYTGKNPYLAQRKAKTLELRVVPPPSVADVPAFVDRVTREHRALEEQARAARKRAHCSVKGAAAVRAQRWHQRPKTATKIFQLTPTLAARRKEIRTAELHALRTFRAQYREARLRFCSGQRKVPFPHGTWLLRVAFGVIIAPPPDLSRRAA